MRKKIAAGNWKMYKTHHEAVELARAIVREALPQEGVSVVLCVPFVHLKTVSDLVAAAPHVHVAAQNCHFAPEGAYTGEVSVSMIRSVGASYVVLGHSERREYFHEGNDELAKKVNAVLAGGLTPIFCCGESLAIREAGTHVGYVGQQLRESLFHLSETDFRRVVIAYEPIWAIGTGVTATPQQAQDMQQALRGLIADQYGAAVAADTTILYGGSVKPNNARELFACPDVDGGLVGGASLQATDFLTIIQSF